MLQRNACVVLGNIGTTDDVAVLEAMLVHEHEIVREHAAWATRSCSEVTGFRVEVGHELLVARLRPRARCPAYAVTRAISGKSSGWRIDATDRSTSSCGQYK